MISKDLLDILVCPETHQPLQLAERSLVERVNRAIGAGTLNNAGGAKVEQKLDGGLLREDGKMLYPVVDEIPVLLVDQAILTEQIDG